MPHISACTWCRKTTRGPRYHSGERKGMPFQISTSASPGRSPMRRPSQAAPGNTA